MFSRLKEIFVDTFAYGSASLLGQLVSFLLLPLYTSYLTTEDYGTLAMLMILVAIFGPAFRLGLPSAVYRYVSRAKTERARRRVIATAYLTTLLSTSVGAILLLLVSPLLSPVLIGEGPLYLTWLTILSAWLFALNDIPQALLRLERRVKTVCLINLLNLVVSAGLAILFVAVWEWGVLGYVLGTLAGVAVQTVLGLLATGSFSVTQFRSRQLRILLSYGLPFVPHHIQAVGIMYLGQYIVRVFVSLEDAGMYSVAMKFVLPFQLIVLSFQSAWKPIKFNIHAQDAQPKETFRRVFSVSCTFMAILFIGTSLLGPALLRLMVHESFHDAAYLVPFLALIPLARGLYVMLSTGVEFATSPRKIPVVSFCGLVAMVATSPLIIWLQAPGAAIVTALAWLAMGATVYVYAQQLYCVKYDFVSAVMVIVTAVIVAPALALSEIPLLYSLAIGTAITLLFIAVMSRTVGIDFSHLSKLSANLHS